MWSYMIEISVGIAYEQNRPTDVAFALRAQFGFWAKSDLKMHCTKMFFRQKLLQITICNFWCKKLFGSPHGCGLCPEGTICFFGEKCLKNALYKIFYHTKVVTKSKFTTFRLFNIFRYLAPLWSYKRLLRYVVCRESIVLSYTTDFYFLGYTKYRESIAFAQKIDFQILMNVHVLRATESKKVIFGMSSVCLSVATITQKIIELAQPNLVCDLIW